MISEWLRVMLEEIARKKSDAEQARIEERRRRDDEPPQAPRPEDSPTRIPRR